MKIEFTVLCVAAALVAAADTAADAVMLRRPQPLRSFLEDIAPVKEVKEEPPAVKEEKPVEAVKLVDEKPVEAVKPVEKKPAAKVEEAPAAEPPKPVVEEPVAEKPAAEVQKPVEAVSAAPEVTVEKAAEEAKKDGKQEKKEKKEKPPARDAIITADRTDYDRKEGVVLFDRNVYVDDAQYQMHADRLFLFLDGTNDLKRLVAIGHVAITNEDKRAYCARATFNKKLGRVVMYSSDEITAQLHEEGKKGSDVKGEKITFWLDSEQVEVENPVITMPGGIGGKESMKKILGK